MKRVAYAEWQKFLLVAFGSRPPEEAEWADYIAFLKRATSGPRVRGLIMSERGSLEPQQRHEVDAILGPHSQRDRRIAVVTTSTFTWGFVKALSVFDPSYRSFRPSESERALAYIEVPRALRDQIWSRASELAAQVV